MCLTLKFSQKLRKISITRISVYFSMMCDLCQNDGCQKGPKFTFWSSKIAKNHQTLLGLNKGILKVVCKSDENWYLYKNCQERDRNSPFLAPETDINPQTWTKLNRSSPLVVWKVYWKFYANRMTNDRLILLKMIIVKKGVKICRFWPLKSSKIT